MKKTLFIILFFITTFCYPQTKIIIYGNAGNFTHDSLVYEAFKIGYGQGFNDANRHYATGNVNDLMPYAIANNYKIIVRSYSCPECWLEYADRYYPKLIFVMPSGCPTHTQCFNYPIPQSILITGAGNTRNMTGYNIELYYRDVIFDMDLQSFSNGFIAGALVKIMDSLNCSIWEARYRLQAANGGVYSNENGYGKCNLRNALSYNKTIPPDTIIKINNTIGNISADKKDNDNFVSVSMEKTQNADTLYLYCNNQLIYQGTNSNYTHIIERSYGGVFEYKYKIKFYNTSYSGFSEAVQIRYKKYMAIYYYKN